MQPEALLTHWQGHRRLTRRLIDAYPEDKLFTFSVGGMRPFGALAQEMLKTSVPLVQQIVAGEWKDDQERGPQSKAELLAAWDEATERLNQLWPQVRPEQFEQEMMAFGQYPGPTYALVMYVIDNEIHHRGQGYVYMRALGVEPPPFYERS